MAPEITVTLRIHRRENPGEQTMSSFNLGILPLHHSVAWCFGRKIKSEEVVYVFTVNLLAFNRRTAT